MAALEKFQFLHPKVTAGDFVIPEARMDPIVGMTACSAGMSDNFVFKPIGHELLPGSQ